MSHRRLRHLPFSLGSGTNGAKLVLHAPAMRGYADGDPVGTWADLSGNGNNATASGNTRPTYKAAIQGGMPVVQYYIDGGKNLTLQTEIITARALFLVVNQVYAAQYYSSYLLGDTSSYEFNRGGAPVVSDGFLYSTIYASLNLKNGSIRINGGELYNNDADLPLSPLILSISTAGNVKFNTLSQDRGSTNRSWRGWYGLLIVYETALTSNGPLSKRIQQSSGFTFRIATK